MEFELALTAFLITIAIMAWLSFAAVMLGSVAEAFVKTRVGQWFDRMFGRLVLVIERVYWAINRAIWTAWHGSANAGRRRG